MTVRQRLGCQARRLRDKVIERWRGFRGRSIYFQLKAFLLVGYVAVVMVTLLWAPPSSHAKNQIGARVLVLEGDIVVGSYLIIENDSGAHWRNVIFEIDDGYRVERDLVMAGEKVTLFIKDFHKRVVRKRRGRDIALRVRAPVDLALTQLRIECSEGDLVEPIHMPAEGRPSAWIP